MKNKPPPSPNIQKLASAATMLQSNPSFKEAMRVVRGAYTEAMINSEPSDAAKREHFHRCIHSLTDIDSALTAFIQSGTLEQITISKQEKAKK